VPTGTCCEFVGEASFVLLRAKAATAFSMS